MKVLNKYKVIITWVTIVILTNLITLNIFTSGYIQLPNTVVLKNESSEFLAQLTKLNYLDKIINNRYIGEIDNEAIGDSLFEALFSSLNDPYSEYFTTEEYETILNAYTGTFGGIGVVINGSNPEALEITDVVVDSPAQEAGIQSGDIIKRVDGEDVTGQSLDVVVSKTRGEIGTPLNLVVERDGTEVEFNLVRAKISGNTIFSENLDGIGYIYISSFGEGTADQFKNELDNLLNQNITDLIIDLRDNGGGLVNSAVEIADYLLDQDILAYALDKDGERVNYTTTDGKIEIPYVILVNENTASASELLAGGIQQAGGIIIGTNTFGKGVVQSMTGLLDNSGYKLTVQEYFLKDGSEVNKVGIEPNYIVELPEEITDESEDSQLNTALEILQNN